MLTLVETGRIYFQVPGKLAADHTPERSISAYIQLIPGHEAIGTIVELGKNVKDFSVGDRCVADVGITVSIPSNTATQTDTSLHLTISSILIDDAIDPSRVT